MTQFLDASAQRYPNLTRWILTRAATFKTKRLIVFLTPGHDWRTGGIMAIDSLYRQSMALRDIHHARGVLCTVPGEPPLLKYDWFENNNYILDLESVLRECSRLDYLLIHIPAYSVDEVLGWLTSASPALLSKFRQIHLNVLVMNIDLIQGKNVLGLKRFGKVTSITAHKAYSNAATREALGVTLHELLICKGPELYTRADYQDKEPILVVSPDRHPLKEQVLEQIAHAYPDLTIQVILNFDYGDYEKLLRRAKWSLTFGEGLDGYFVEQVFSGGVAFAVFNDRFFTPAYAELETVYPSLEVLMERMTADMRRLDEPMAYNRCWRQAYELLSKDFNTNRYLENLRLFYRGEYTFP